MHGCSLWPGRSHFSLTRLPPFVITTFFFPPHPLSPFFPLPIDTWFINFNQWEPQWWNLKVQMRYNEPTWLLDKKDYMSFLPKKTFSYEWILEQFFLQLIIINAYSCPSMWHVFFSSFWNKYEFLKVSWFLVNSVFHFFKWL